MQDLEPESASANEPETESEVSERTFSQESDAGAPEPANVAMSLDAESKHTDIELNETGTVATLQSKSVSAFARSTTGKKSIESYNILATLLEPWSDTSWTYSFHARSWAHSVL
eukprot:SAG31_NODE_6048_length_2192_cov_2.365504_3_plen_114_part_00